MFINIIYNPMNLAVLHVRAQKLAQDALVGVTDKVGKPIYEHCQRVASKFPMSAERIVAILHEIVEDSDVTPRRPVSRV